MTAGFTTGGDGMVLMRLSCEGVLDVSGKQIRLDDTPRREVPVQREEVAERAAQLPHGISSRCRARS